MKSYLDFTQGRQVRRVVLAVSLALTLTACFGEDKASTEQQTDAVGYLAINHTDIPIVSIIINGEGGILHADAQGGGGEMCCVVLPHKWRPGLMATIKWREDGDWLKDANGKEVIRDGIRVYVPAPWKTKTVEVPEYKGEDVHGQFHIHFFPNDEIKVLRSVKGILQSEYPIPYPVKPTSK
jgi:hypothetical protein